MECIGKEGGIPGGPRGRSELSGMWSTGEEAGLSGWREPAGQQRVCGQTWWLVGLRDSGMWGTGKHWEQRGARVLLADWEVPRMQRQQELDSRCSQRKGRACVLFQARRAEAVARTKVGNPLGRAWDTPAPPRWVRSQPPALLFPPAFAAPPLEQVTCPKVPAEESGPPASACSSAPCSLWASVSPSASTTRRGSSAVLML